MTPAPLIFRWDGEAMVPLMPKVADRLYVVGETYRLGVIEERSPRSHAHYFACVNEAWTNLPDELIERFPTAEHLRKWALIKAGFADHRSIVCSSKAEAQRVMSFCKPMDEYAVVTLRDAVVTVYTAQSQSMKAMGRKPFQASKDAVLDILSQMVGVTKDALAQNAGRAA